MTTHPRTQLRRDLRQVISQGMTGVDVYVNKSRADFRINGRPAVLLYTPSETINRPGASRDRPGAPLQRSISVEILVMCEGDDDETVADLADEACADLEKLLGVEAPALVFESTDTELGGDSRSARALVTLRYTLEQLDKLE